MDRHFNLHTNAIASSFSAFLNSFMSSHSAFRLITRQQKERKKRKKKNKNNKNK